jgi:hypothetical protein
LEPALQPATVKEAATTAATSPLNNKDVRDIRSPQVRR